MHAMLGFVVLTPPLEAEYALPPSTNAEHASLPTSRTHETQDAVSVTCDDRDEGLSSIQRLVSES